MEYQLSIYGVVELVISVFVLCVQSPSKVTKRTSVLSSLTVTASKCETKHKLCHLWQLTGDQKKLAKLQKASFGCLVSGRYIQSQREHADLSLSLFSVYTCVYVCVVCVLAQGRCLCRWSHCSTSTATHRTKLSQMSKQFLWLVWEDRTFLIRGWKFT